MVLLPRSTVIWLSIHTTGQRRNNDIGGTMKKTIIILLLLLLGCATTPRLRNHLFSYKTRGVIKHVHSNEIPFFWWYIELQDGTIIETKDGLRHKINGNWGEVGDTISIEIGLPSLLP